ncbi:hypothetical protein CCB80_03110 [Armatimonadetes bacterium Uphvl-Ar1]|nr:hypothetical protein CCB80_03110 [Armatimonadetes bacterium Uphvl-Ar1]
MTPASIAEIQLLAERAERSKIAANIRLLAVQGREDARKSGRDERSTAILDQLADMIERGDFSE